MRMVAMDTEYHGDEVLTVAVADRDSSLSAEILDLHLPDVLNAITEREYVVGHNVWADIPKLAQFMEIPARWVRGDRTLDSQLLARMVEENGPKGTYKLENLLASIFNVDQWKGDTDALAGKNNIVNAAEWPVDLRRERCRLDAWASRMVAEDRYKRLRHQVSLVEFTHRIAAVLHRVALTGAVVDLGRLEAMTSSLATAREEQLLLLNSMAIASGVTNFSPTNDDSIRELLYEKLGLPVAVRTRTGLAGVDKISLSNLKHEVADALVRFNTIDKVYSVNGIGLGNLVRAAGCVDGAPAGWLPFYINPLGARTGRRSSTNPNSQNWPKPVRNIVRSRFADGSIFDNDYKRLEVVLVAWLAGDQSLLEAFTTGRGYLDIALRLWGTEIAADTPQYTATKSVVLGTNYNLKFRNMAYQLWNKAGVRFSENYDEHVLKTKEVHETYLDQHKPLVRFMEAREAEMLRHQKVVNLAGRPRHLPVPQGRNTANYHHFLNQAINFPVQSLASEITGSAMLDIEEAILSHFKISYEEYYKLLLENRKYFLTNPADHEIIPPLRIPCIINEVHDDVVVDSPPEYIKLTEEIVVETMRAVPSLRALCPSFDAPIDVDTVHAPFWAEKKK